jgi:hypothetical protein
MTLARGGGEGRGGSRHPLAAAGVVAAVAVVVAARIWLAARVETPWILIDELLYASLAESIASEGRLAVRGEPMATSVLYPLLVAPAWLAREMETTVLLAKAINVVAMSAAAVPVYLWTRRLAGARAALAAAGLTLLLPGLAYATALMTENLFFPLFVAAAYALARALEVPSTGRWLLVLALAAAAVGTRPQGLVLGPVLVAAALLFAALERRREELRRALPWAALPVAGLVLVWAGAPLPFVDVGPYRGALEAAYDPGEVARWAAYNAGALALAAGILPATAFLVLAGRAATRADRAFVAAAGASIAGLVLLAGATSTLDPPGIRERYAFHAAPLLLIALAVWLARGAPRGRLAAAAALVPVLLVAALPLRTIFGSGSFLGDGFSLIAFWRLARVLPGDVTAAKAILVAGAVAAAAAFLLTPRGAARTVLPAAVALYLGASSAAVLATVRSQALGASLQSGQHERPGWIDDAVGRDAEVVFLSVRPTHPAEWMPVWRAELWNRSLGAVVAAGAAEPSPLLQRVADLAPDGRIADLPQHVLVGEGVEVDGDEIARSGPLRLVRVESPVRVAAGEDG